MNTYVKEKTDQERLSVNTFIQVYDLQENIIVLQSRIHVGRGVGMPKCPHVSQPFTQRSFSGFVVFRDVFVVSFQIVTLITFEVIKDA